MSLVTSTPTKKAARRRRDSAATAERGAKVAERGLPLAAGGDATAKRGASPAAGGAPLFKRGAPHLTKLSPLFVGGAPLFKKLPPRGAGGAPHAAKLSPPAAGGVPLLAVLSPHFKRGVAICQKNGLFFKNLMFFHPANAERVGDGGEGSLSRRNEMETEAQHRRKRVGAKRGRWKTSAQIRNEKSQRDLIIQPSVGRRSRPTLGGWADVKQP